jgi:hypothetical protein
MRESSDNDKISTRHDDQTRADGSEQSRFFPTLHKAPLDDARLNEQGGFFDQKPQFFSEAFKAAYNEDADIIDRVEYSLSSDNEEHSAEL